MKASHLNGVLAEYETQIDTPRETCRARYYLPVRIYLDMVIKVDKIIGSADHDRKLRSMEIYFGAFRRRQYATMRFRPSEPSDEAKILWSTPAYALGMFDSLPSNTIFEEPLRRDVLPSRTIIHLNDFKVVFPIM